jgi:hypothetical protein
MDVHLGRVELELSNAGDRLGGKGFVELDQIAIRDGTAGGRARRIDFEPRRT